MQGKILIAALMSLLLSNCYHRPPPVVSEVQPGGIYEHMFAPDYINYGVCNDTLAAVWGKASGNTLDLWVSWSVKPLEWEGHLFAGSVDPAVLQEWGSIPAKAPFDFDCRQSLLTTTSQSKNYEIYQSPVQAPFRCATLYDKWMTIVDRNTHRAYPTAMLLQEGIEILEWKGKLWIGTSKGLSEVDPQALSSDQDKDGLTDLVEHLIGTMIDNADTDEDGTPDAVDVEPFAGLRPWNATDSLYAKELMDKVYKMEDRGACVRFVNVVAPRDLEPLQIPLPTGIRLIWNVEEWNGESIVLKGSL